jgi:transglutaminase-like putative cysteine protease
MPRAWSRPLSLVVLTAWLVQMGLLAQRTFLEAAPVALAADLARYGTAAHWKGIYYRGEKVGFSVGQTLPSEGGYELQEDGQLQLNLMGATTAARLRTRAHVDREFRLQSFSFSLDPGTGPIEVEGRVAGTTLHYSVSSRAGRRSESRELAEAPQLSLNLPRRLAAAGLEAGQLHEVSVFDPATLRNAPMRIEIEARELVRRSGRPIPAFRVRSTFSGITSTSWITETGEVVREESPMGLIVVRESRERAIAVAVAGDIGRDMLEAAAVVPRSDRRIEDPRAVRRLRLRLSGVELASPDLDGGAQRWDGDDVIELRDPRDLEPGPAGTELAPLLAPAPLIESDAPEIVAEVERALAGAPAAPRDRAERLVRYVNARLEKKPTLSIPSALEVLRSGVGDCNEHTALYVAMARAAGLPARIAVGLVHLHGAFYYHAWPEVWVAASDTRGTWLPVDPTLNQFPADATHLRLARGDLSQQVEILGYLGRLQIEVLELEIGEEAAPILVGQDIQTALPVDLPATRLDGPGSCWRSSAPGSHP